MGACRYLFYGLVAVSLVQVVYYYPQMPQVVASHFDGAGAANGWSGRNVFFGIYLGITALLIAVFAVLPGWSMNRSGLGLNIPHRDYWLAPDRREQTRDFFNRQMLIMGALHQLLGIFAVQLAILANLEQQTRLHGSIFCALGLYLVLVSAWLLHFLLHFRKT